MDCAIDNGDSREPLFLGEEFCQTRHMFLGCKRLFILPVARGWVLPGSLIPYRPEFEPGVDEGLFVGWQGTKLAVRASGVGDFVEHHTSVHSGSEVTDIVLRNIEASDSVSSTANSFSFIGQIWTGWDGVHARVSETAPMAIRHELRETFRAHRVNHNVGDLGPANGYVIKPPSANGLPPFVKATDTGVFVGHVEGIWQIRFSAGGSGQRYIGTLISSEPIISVSAVKLESSDIISQPSVDTVFFDTRVYGSSLDGIDVEVSPDALLTLEFTNPLGGVTQVLIGEDAWPVEALPVEFTAP